MARSTPVSDSGWLCRKRLRFRDVLRWPV